MNQVIDALQSGDVGKVRQMAQSMAEQRAKEWISDVRSDIKTKRAKSWPSDKEAIEKAQKIEQSGNTDKLLQDTMIDVQEKIIIVLMRYLETVENPGEAGDGLKEAASDLISELHDPQVREALLLSVQEEHREYLRSRFDSIGSLFWGLVDLGEGEETEDLWLFMDILAEFKGLSLEEVVAGADDVSVENIPDEYRD